MANALISQGSILPSADSSSPFAISFDFPDLWQQEAVRHLKAGLDVLVDAPTGAGKTRIFELFVESGDAARRGQAVYTVPTRALANDKFTEWQQRGWNVGIATGDLAENLRAPVIVATLETQREKFLGGNAPATLIIDEYQMVADARRGLNYELALALAPLSTQLLLMSGSVRNPGDIAEWLSRLGRRCEVISVQERPVPLNELPVENLPAVPDHITGFWARMAAAAHRAGLTPLLIFAPRRADAERIARKASEGLPPAEPIPIAQEDEPLLGRDLAKLITRRAAYHHSGLSYRARAGWIEPLAKNGHLHIIASTTGLAAGINFSVRSVFVAGTTYTDGPFQRELRADELLQMFGRAGRRGLDREGTVLVARDSPRLFDAAKRHIRRVNEIDWPSLLRVMEGAADRGLDPLEEARRACASLFSPQAPSLGLEVHHTEEAEAPTSPFSPGREEILDSIGKWVPARSLHAERRPVADALAHHRDQWHPAAQVPKIMEAFGQGRLCKLPSAHGFTYGKEIAVARREDSFLEPLPWVRKAVRLRRSDRFDDGELLRVVVPLVIGETIPASAVAKVVGLIDRGPVVAVQIDWSASLIDVIVDHHGAALVNPPRRRAHPETEIYRPGEHGAQAFNPRPGTAVHAWRQLGLIDSYGVPTLRGRIFSRFQNGEGLVIAAAVEDERYRIEEILQHLANIRGGHRFSDLATGESDRLAASSRAAYGHLDHPGYLEAGLNPGYGDGTSETLDRYRSGGIRAIPSDSLVSRGDIERAQLEWISLLRHITHATGIDSRRFAELQQGAANLVQNYQPADLRQSRLPARFRQR